MRSFAAVGGSRFVPLPGRCLAGYLLSRNLVYWARSYDVRMSQASGRHFLVVRRRRSNGVAAASHSRETFSTPLRLHRLVCALFNVASIIRTQHGYGRRSTTPNFALWGNRIVGLIVLCAYTEKSLSQYLFVRVQSISVRPPVVRCAPLARSLESHSFNISLPQST